MAWVISCLSMSRIASLKGQPVLPLVAGQYYDYRARILSGPDSRRIRIENQVEIESCRGFCKFATLTTDPNRPQRSRTQSDDEQEKQWLDEYHQQVRGPLSPLVEGDARPWLVEATAPIRETLGAVLLPGGGFALPGLKSVGPVKRSATRQPAAQKQKACFKSSFSR